MVFEHRGGNTISKTSTSGNGKYCQTQVEADTGRRASSRSFVRLCSVPQVPAHSRMKPTVSPSSGDLRYPTGS